MSREPYDAKQHQIEVLERIAEALERIADKVAPTPEQLEDQTFRKSEAALRDYDRVFGGGVR